MQSWEWVVVGIAIAVVVVLALVFAQIRRRRTHLKERFGTEYFRAVSSEGTAGGEKHLSQVEQDRNRLEIRPLTSAARERYLEEWKHVEARFVSDPREAARAAERIVERALEERGYPSVEEVDETEQRAAVVAVDHADVAERYRHGRAMLSQLEGAESTEKLRKAIIDFRTVLDALLEGEPTVA